VQYNYESFKDLKKRKSSKNKLITQADMEKGMTSMMAQFYEELRRERLHVDMVKNYPETLQYLQTLDSISDKKRLPEIAKDDFVDTPSPKPAIKPVAQNNQNDNVGNKSDDKPNDNDSKNDKSDDKNYKNDKKVLSSNLSSKTPMASMTAVTGIAKDEITDDNVTDDSNDKNDNTEEEDPIIQIQEMELTEESLKKAISKARKKINTAVYRLEHGKGKRTTSEENKRIGELELKRLLQLQEKMESEQEKDKGQDTSQDYELEP